MEVLTVGSLFSGIGGIDLGLERAGMRVIWQSEIDPYASAVLRQHWPEIPNLGDVRRCTRFASVAVLCGGFPCQPVSQAGKRLRQEDPRWLWPEFCRVIRLARPRYVLVENVPGLLAGGMGDVLRDLASLGFDAEWDSIPAAAVGAPHLRYRVLLVAHAQQQQGGERRDVDGERRRTPEAEQAGLGSSDVADARRVDSERRRAPGQVASTPGAREGEASERQRLRDAPEHRGTALAHAYSRDSDRRGIFDQVGWKRLQASLAEARDAGRTQW